MRPRPASQTSSDRARRPLLTDKESARPTTALRDLDADLELLGATLDEVCHASGAAEILSLRTRAVELARGARGGDADGR